MTSDPSSLSDAELKTRLDALLANGVQRYAGGQRGADGFFTPDEVAFLAALGCRPQEMYDFAEDYQRGGEPLPELAIRLTLARRNYFRDVQSGQWSEKEIDMDKLPPKAEAVEGIVWLPRIIPKAKAKLRGEMPADLMYGCGGDRRFSKDHGIDLGELLETVAKAGEDDAAVIRWVKEKSAQRGE